MQVAQLKRLYGGLQFVYASKGLIAIFPCISGSAALLKFLFLKAANKNVQPPFFGLQLGHAVMEHRREEGTRRHLRALHAPGKILALHCQITKQTSPKRTKQCIPRARKKRKEEWIGMTTAIVSFSFIRPFDVLYSNKEIVGMYPLNLNCMHGLPRQPSGGRVRYQLGRKKKSPISDPTHNLYTVLPQPTNKRIYSRAPNATAAVLGDPNRPGSTPFSSGLRGTVSQKRVDSMTPPLVVQRAARVLAVCDGVVDQNLLDVGPRKLSKARHRVGVFLQRTRPHASASARSALIALIPASTTQGSFFESRGPPLATHRLCQLWATCPISVWAIPLSSRA